MIKRILAILLVLSVLFMVACSSGGTSEPDGSSPSGSVADKPSTATPNYPHDNTPGDYVGGNEIPLPGNQSESKSSSSASSKASDVYDYGEGYRRWYGYDYEDNYSEYNREKYLPIDENNSVKTDFESMLTFSLKIDTAAYTNIERYILNGDEPPVDAVRTEELINYFNYENVIVDKEGPFSMYTEIGPSPFNKDKLMAYMRIKTDEVSSRKRQPSHLTFLIDTSGSMDSYDKLPLLQDSMHMLVDNLTENDYVSIVTYAGSSEVVLESRRVTSDNKKSIIKAINNLTAGGSTAGADGIKTAYEIASEYFLKNGNNRVILATDGDFNVGISNIGELEDFISSYRDEGIYLSVLGFGTGNIREDIMETLSKHGNGNYNYINTLRTANKVLVEELSSNLYVVAKDVKAQVEFNPNNVKNYRLIGYENRMLDNRDFNDDTKDAGEIGLGSDVVVMFEIELQESYDYKYSSQPKTDRNDAYYNELFELRIRYKEPNREDSKLIKRVATFGDVTSKNSNDFSFACSVAAFGDILRDSRFSNEMTVSDIIKLADKGKAYKKENKTYREEFISMLKAYNRIVD